MGNQFMEGDKVAALYFPDDTEVVAGEHDIEKITVVMECGQMAAVPWFAVWIDGKIDAKHNAAHVATVKMAVKHLGEEQ